MPRIAAPLALALTAVAFSSSAFAGPINPPAGPVTSTMKTMTEVEPRTAINSTNTPGDNDSTPSLFKITQPGSYYLTGNIAVGAGLDGIEIASANVTIDLNGFTLYGLPGAETGISAGGSFRVALTIRNGVIRTFREGLDIATTPGTTNSNAQGAVLESLQVLDNTNAGALINDGLVRDSVFNRNGTGLSISQYHPSTVDSSTFSDNDQTGLYTRLGTVTNSSATGNGTNGISSQHISNCIARSNGTTGLFGDVVTGCTAVDNGVDGIRVNISATDNTVIKSPSIGSGTNGIVINADRVRVEGNTITGLPIGIKSIHTNGFIAGNKFSWCTSALNVIAGNRVGAIVTGTSSPAINGNSGGGLGTSDPYANILY